MLESLCPDTKSYLGTGAAFSQFWCHPQFLTFTVGQTLFCYGLNFLMGTKNGFSLSVIQQIFSQCQVHSRHYIQQVCVSMCSIWGFQKINHQYNEELNFIANIYWKKKAKVSKATSLESGSVLTVTVEVKGVFLLEVMEACKRRSLFSEFGTSTDCRSLTTRARICLPLQSGHSGNLAENTSHAGFSAFVLLRNPHFFNICDHAHFWAPSTRDCDHAQGTKMFDFYKYRSYHNNDKCMTILPNPKCSSNY